MSEKKPVEVGEFRNNNVELEENSFIASSADDHCVSTDCSELEEPPTKGRSVLFLNRNSPELLVMFA